MNITCLPASTCNNSPKFVAYFRVSTQRQGQSGLGLDAQKAAVSEFLASSGGELLGEFVEIESGKKAKRPQLEEALKAAKKQKATLIIAKLDRLARNVHFISGLMASGVDFLACDMPTANKLTIHILAAVAEDEAERISQRTKAALAAAKARGVKLGKTAKVLAAKNKHQAELRAAQVITHIDSARNEGAKTYAQIATILNQNGVETANGAKWHPTSVMRVIKRIEQKAA
jgi:DNA invertase Pin-like site-specific DNA recombinase